MQVLWRLISCVNLNRPWGAQTLGPAWFWECLWGCFWMKLTLNWWTLESEWLCPVWAGLVQPFEGLNRTNRWQKRRLLLSDCELGHQSLDLDWNIGSPGSSFCWLRCTYVCVLVLSLKNPNTDVFLCQWMRTPCILSMTSPCQLHQVCPETYLILPLGAEFVDSFLLPWTSLYLYCSACVKIPAIHTCGRHSFWSLIFSLMN